VLLLVGAGELGDWCLLPVGVGKLCKVGALQWLDLDWIPSNLIQGCSHIGEPRYIMCYVITLDVLSLFGFISLLHKLQFSEFKVLKLKH